VPARGGNRVYRGRRPISAMAASKEALEQAPRRAVECGGVWHPELQAIARGDEQTRAAAQAADVLLALEHELRRTAIRLHLPGAGRGKARNGEDFSITAANPRTASSSSTRRRSAALSSSRCATHTTSCPSAPSSASPSCGAAMGKARTGVTSSCTLPSAMVSTRRPCASRCSMSTAPVRAEAGEILGSMQAFLRVKLPQPGAPNAAGCFQSPRPRPRRLPRRGAPAPGTAANTRPGAP